ncbi:MAG: GtrA family protein [Solirubrobacterales bacterium]
MSDQLTADEAIIDPAAPGDHSSSVDPSNDEVTAGAPRVRAHTRVRHGVRHPHNWIQLIKFGAVGASGYVVNLIAYELARGGLELHYLIAAVVAFVFAVTNNFLWNRYWTFKARDGHAGFQAARFFVVSLVALGFNLLVLAALVDLGIGEFPAQAIAIVCATPLNFIGNKMWSFSER